MTCLNDEVYCWEPKRLIQINALLLDVRVRGQKKKKEKNERKEKRGKKSEMRPRNLTLMNVSVSLAGSDRE